MNKRIESITDRNPTDNNNRELPVSSTGRGKDVTVQMDSRDLLRRGIYESQPRLGRKVIVLGNLQNGKKIQKKIDTTSETSCQGRHLREVSV